MLVYGQLVTVGSGTHKGKKKKPADLFPSSQSRLSWEVLAAANGFGYLPGFNRIMFDPTAHGI